MCVWACWPARARPGAAAASLRLHHHQVILAELVLPVLLVLGLFTRYAALGLLVMTAVIQLTVPDGWANFHLPWAAMALTLVVYGGGRIALDALVKLRRH